MAEFNMQIMDSETMLLNYEPINSNIVIFNEIPILPTRTIKTYNEFQVLPFFHNFTDENGVELNFKREVREWDVVLPFGTDNNAPRRTPTEINYKGRKSKNKFV